MPGRHHPPSKSRNPRKRAAVITAVCLLVVSLTVWLDPDPRATKARSPVGAGGATFQIRPTGPPRTIVPTGLPHPDHELDVVLRDLLDEPPVRAPTRGTTARPTPVPRKASPTPSPTAQPGPLILPTPTPSPCPSLQLQIQPPDVSLETDLP